MSTDSVDSLVHGIMNCVKNIFKNVNSFEIM